MAPRCRCQRLEPAVALLGLAPHRAQGRGRELTLDVLHVALRCLPAPEPELAARAAAFALPLRCFAAAVRRAATRVLCSCSRQLLLKTSSRLGAATTVLCAATTYMLAND